ncbi:MAG: RNA polymerase II transcription factor B subunit 1 [Bathelium mastoideum]|nr:MAG: RNA polymerase II transcription factor B subunit 1 [Bathelium mastoideum]
MAFRAAYKKQAGKLLFSARQDHVEWSPDAAAAASNSVRISVKDVINLQRTPPSSEKRAVMISVQQPGAAAPDKYRFDFNSSSAATDQDAFTEKLSTLIKNIKTLPESTPGTPLGTERSKNDASRANADSSGSHYDSEDMRLIKDVKLQEALTREKPSVAQELRHAITNKAQFVSLKDLTQDFWSSRLPMLRSFAAEHGQKPGQFNAFSAIQAKTVDGESKIDLPAEVIELLFEQHPVVKRAFSDLVPKVFSNAVGFWRAFLNSKLYKKLRGEKVADATGNAQIDKYLEYSAATAEAHIPRFDDLEGNEQNHSQRKGNQPDITMRASTGESLQTLRSLNNISQALMSRINPDEAEAFDTQLHDLQADLPDNRVALNIKDQALLANSKRDPASDEAALFANLKPKDVAQGMRNDVAHQIQLEKMNNVDDLDDNDDQDDDDDEDEAYNTARAFNTAAEGSLQAFRRQRRLDFSSAPPSAPETLTNSHQTLMWTLKRFWTIFLSGDAARANELQEVVAQLATHLKSVESIASTPPEKALVAPTKGAVTAAVMQYRLAREAAKAAV